LDTSGSELIGAGLISPLTVRNNCSPSGIVGPDAAATAAAAAFAAALVNARVERETGGPIVGRGAVCERMVDNGRFSACERINASVGDDVVFVRRGCFALGLD